MTPTPRPWRADKIPQSLTVHGEGNEQRWAVCCEAGKDLAYCDSQETANFIALAVNSYDAMREALEAMLTELRRLRDNKPNEWDALVSPELCTAWDTAQAALALAQTQEVRS